MVGCITFWTTGRDILGCCMRMKVHIWVMAVGVSRFVRVRFRSEVITNLDVEIKSLNPKFSVVISRARLKLPPPFDK